MNVSGYNNVYRAKNDTLFEGYEDGDGWVSIMSSGDRAGYLVPIEDLVEFVEIVYHGSEMPTAKEE